jgi:decaprenylphospho-beta-D-erythro-pentofuranosid-2-ulose 2-reductase
MSSGILITGATSTIARALAEQLAADGHSLLLAARNLEEIDRTAADLRLRFGVPVQTIGFDAREFDDHGQFVSDCLGRLDGELETVIACHGLLIDQHKAQDNPPDALEMIDINYRSIVSIFERFAAAFEQRGHGTLAAISSVAGDRGRKSNYLYGAPKAALSCYLEGLRYRLAARGVHVLTIKPGFVDTPMTWGLKAPRPLIASPQKVARDIRRALKRRRAVLYTPWFWRWIMLIIRMIPAPLFRRMSI